MRRKGQEVNCHWCLSMLIVASLHNYSPIFASFSYDITKYDSTLYIGMDEVLAHYACTFEILDLHFYFR